MSIQGKGLLYIYIIPFMRFNGGSDGIYIYVYVYISMYLIIESERKKRKVVSMVADKTIKSWTIVAFINCSNPVFGRQAANTRSLWMPQVRYFA